MTSKINPSNLPPIINNQAAKPVRSEPVREIFISKFVEFKQNYHKSMKVRSEIPTKQKNTKWLYNKKRWAEGQLEKIKEIQNLQKNNNLRIKNQQQFTDTFKKANTFYNDLVKKIQTEIKKSPPLIAFKEHVKPAQLGPIDRIVRSIGECVTKIMQILKHGWMFKKMNDLLGEYQNVSAGNMILLKRVLEAPEFKGFLGLEHSTPGNHFNHLLDELTEIRDRQLEMILTGRRALNVRDTLPSGISINEIQLKVEGFIMALKMFKAQLNEDGQEQMDEIINLVSVLIENATPRNTQAISDCLYPQCVLRSKNFKAPSSTVERSLTDRIEASKKEGHLKGFINRNCSNLLERTGWQAIKVVKDDLENDIFVKGFYHISLQTPDGHEAFSGAELDLSPLGPLNEGQVKKIFDLTSTLLAGRFELLGENVEKLTENEKNLRENLLQKVEGQIKDLELSDKKVRKLREIVSNFSYKITSAMTLAFLTVGHKYD